MAAEPPPPGRPPAPAGLRWHAAALATRSAATTDTVCLSMIIFIAAAALQSRCQHPRASSSAKGREGNDIKRCVEWNLLYSQQCPPRFDARHLRTARYAHGY